jgi:hypothetical protein
VKTDEFSISEMIQNGDSPVIAGVAKQQIGEREWTSLKKRCEANE